MSKEQSPRELWQEAFNKENADLTYGRIAGNRVGVEGNHERGRITVRLDGSILLENVDLINIAITNCDLHAESGEYPIPFADRMNQLEDFASSPAQKTTPLHAGHTCYPTDDPDSVCYLCETEG